MAIAYTIKKYKCQYRCGFSQRNETEVIEHEDGCLKNPDKKSCVTCRAAYFYREDGYLCIDCHGREDDAISTDDNGNAVPAVNCDFWRP